MSEIPADAPKPRMCHIIKWPDFDGYGFNLHADKSRPGQYIGKVDENSPADVAGLKEGDRIIEVNGVNIMNENHKQVVQRIKNIPNETKLLVVDSETDRWYKEKNIVVRGDLENIAYGTSVKSSSISSLVEPVAVATNGDVKQINDGDSHSINSAQSSQSGRSSQPPQLPSNCSSEATQEEEIPAPAAELMNSEISVSITDYDNIIFAQENERKDEIAPNDVKSESSDEMKEQDNVEAKIESLEICVHDEDDNKCVNDDAIIKRANDEASIKSANDEASIKSDNYEASIKSDNDEACIKFDNDDVSIKSDKVNAAVSALDDDVESIKSSKDDESCKDKNSEKVSEASSIDNERKDDVLETESRSSSVEMKSSTSTKCAEEPSLEIPISKIVEHETNSQQDLTKSSVSPTPSPPPPIETEMSSRKPEVQADSSNKAKTSMKNGGLNLNMTVAEMRAQLAAKKKFDPRKDQIDLKKKYQIIQNM